MIVCCTDGGEMTIRDVSLQRHLHFEGRCFPDRAIVKRILVILLVFSLSGFPLTGCSTTRSNGYEPEQKGALRTLAGGAIGALLAGNTGGAIVGAMIVDIYNIKTVKYEDIQLENGDQAARKYKNGDKEARKKRDGERKAVVPREDGKKAEQQRQDDKKAVVPTEDEKKAEQRRQDEKKAVVPTEDEKKAAQIKEDQKKAEQEKTYEKSVQLFIEGSGIASQTVRPGATVEANVQYTVIASDETEPIKITETRLLSTMNRTMEVAKREVMRTQGTYKSIIRFTVPEDAPKGYCILFTTVSAEKKARSAKSVINII